MAMVVALFRQISSPEGYVAVSIFGGDGGGCGQPREDHKVTKNTDSAFIHSSIKIYLELLSIFHSS